MRNICKIEDCGLYVKGHGWCSKHYTRWRKSGDPLVCENPASLTWQERFWRKVDKYGGYPNFEDPLMLLSGEDGECWLWTGHLNNAGYGKFNSLSMGNWLAPRLSLHMLGRLQDGHTVDHLCRRPQCVNPDHLESVPMLTNIRRSSAISQRHRARTHCGRGHEFTEDNTLQRSDGGRRCRTCQRADNLKKMERRRLQR